MTWLRENDGSLSPLASAKPWMESGLFLCIRENGSLIVAAAEDLVDDLTETA